MQIKILNTGLLAFITLVMIGCAAPVQNTAEDKNQLTLGKVQESLKKGMRQDEVVAAIGSPNMVTKDSAGNTTWIYDKFRTETNTNAAQGSSFFGMSSSANVNTVRSQKTLTVVLKFKGNILTDINYNASSF